MPLLPAFAHPAAPLWTVGFRPFFALAMLSGALLPVLWGLVFAGGLTPPTPLALLQWHAHEMFFGFGWAVLGGFLLTATKNWVQIRGYHGLALMLLTTAWCVERLVVSFGAPLPGWLFVLGANLFLPSVVLMLLHSLIRYRHQDSFDDNYFFLIILPVFLLAKNLLLSPDGFEAGYGMTLALFRVAFLVMLERTLSGFMRGAFGLAIRREKWLDLPIKGLAVLLIAAPWLPTLMVGGLSLLLALLLLGRFLLWHPRQAFSRLDIGIMYFGYLGIVAQLLATSASTVAGFAWVGSVNVHLFSFGVMGLIIPAMLIRISNGHTGRPVRFDRRDKLALHLMLLGFVCRIVLPQLWPVAYLHWVALAAVTWFACFSLLAWRYLPYYLRPRADGRPF